MASTATATAPLASTATVALTAASAATASTSVHHHNSSHAASLEELRGTLAALAATPPAEQWSKAELHLELVRQQGVIVELLLKPLSQGSLDVLVEVLNQFRAFFKGAKKVLKNNDQGRLFLRQTSRWLKGSELGLRVKQKASRMFPSDKGRIEFHRSFVESALRARNLQDALKYEAELSHVVVQKAQRLRLTKEGAEYWEEIKEFLADVAQRTEEIQKAINQKLLAALSAVIECEQNLKLEFTDEAVLTYEKASDAVERFIKTEPGAMFQEQAQEVLRRYRLVEARMDELVGPRETQEILRELHGELALEEHDDLLGAPNPIDAIIARALRETAALQIV